jgi:hypothetical protein
MKEVTITKMGGSAPYEIPRYFIDCPVVHELEPVKVQRIEIPSSLAAFITQLQHENKMMRDELRGIEEEGR